MTMLLRDYDIAGNLIELTPPSPSPLDRLAMLEAIGNNTSNKPPVYKSSSGLTAHSTRTYKHKQA